MPELPEVEVLAAICAADSRQNHSWRGRAARKSAGPNFDSQIPPNPAGRKIHRIVASRQISAVSTSRKTGGEPVTLLGHLGMTGRIYLARKNGRLPGMRRWCSIWAVKI